jgi:hypothetical protein
MTAGFEVYIQRGTGYRPGGTGEGIGFSMG